MLLINRTDMLSVAVNVLGFFTGSGNVIPFSVDLSDFRRSFRVESNTTIKIFIGYDVLSSSMKCTTSSKEAGLLTFGRQFDIGSYSGCKIE